MPTGAAIGRHRIPKIGASYDIVQGTDTASLEKGPGHYPATAFPGSDRRSRSPATARPTWRRSATSTSSAGRPDRGRDAVRPLHLRRPVPPDRDCRRLWIRPTTSATSGSCCRPATRSSAPPSGSSCSRGCRVSSRRQSGRGGADRRDAGCGIVGHLVSVDSGLDPMVSDCGDADAEQNSNGREHERQVTRDARA